MILNHDAIVIIIIFLVRILFNCSSFYFVNRSIWADGIVYIILMKQSVDCVTDCNV